MAAPKKSKTKKPAGRIPLSQIRAAAAAKAEQAITAPKSVSERKAVPVRKPVAKVKAKKTVAKKIAATISSRVAESTERRRLTPAPVKPPAKKPVKLSAAELKAFKSELLYMRGRLADKVKRQSKASLKREDENIRGEEGTESFERFFALENTGTDQEIIYHIDEALRSIKEGNYGVCKNCGSLIQKPRLQALPFAKLCIRCQALQEKQDSANQRPVGRARQPEC